MRPRDRVLRIGSLFIAEIHPRMQPDIDAAGDDPDRDVRRHQATVGIGNAAGLDRLEAELAGLGVGRLATPADEVGIGSTTLLRGRVVETSRIRLPDLDQSVGQRLAGAVEDATLDQDALTLSLGRHQHEPEIALPDTGDLDPIRVGPDMHIGAGGLRGALLEAVEALGHHNPSSLFSNSV